CNRPEPRPGFDERAKSRAGPRRAAAAPPPSGVVVPPRGSSPRGPTETPASIGRDTPGNRRLVGREGARTPAGSAPRESSPPVLAFPEQPDRLGQLDRIALGACDHPKLELSAFVVASPRRIPDGIHKRALHLIYAAQQLFPQCWRDVGSEHPGHAVQRCDSLFHAFAL